MPSKVTDYQDSTLANFPKILKKIEKQSLNPRALFKKTRRYFNDIGEFAETLDYLYLLDRISIDEETGVIHSVKGN